MQSKSIIPGDSDELLNQESVAKFLGTTEKFLEARRVRGGGPPFVKIGRLVRYEPESLKAWVKSRRMNSTIDNAS